MKAVFLDFATMGDGLDLGVLEAAVGELRVFDSTSDDELPGRIADADFVFTNKMRLSDELLSGAPKLRFIGLTATGCDNVDLDAARRGGIAVANIRGYCTQSVVEHVLGVLLMLTHNLGAYRASVTAGEWQRAGMPFLLAHPIRQLGGLTLGIVGHGELGRGVAAAGEALGMRVLVAARADAARIPDGRVPFRALLAESDVISLHCPLTDATRNLFGPDEFRQMKASALLVNTARGGLVDSAALADALRNGTIAGAAVDVLPTEPPVDGDPLLDYTGDNLIVTPHVAWASAEARQNAIDELAANARAFMAGETRNRVDQTLA